MTATLNRSRLVVGLTALLAGCGDETPPDAPLRPVVYQEVDYARGDSKRTFSGTAVTGRVVNMSFRSGGVVTRLDVTPGQRVRAGELLAQLDNVPARLAYEQAVLAVNSAASQMNTARLALRRTRALYESGTASLSDYESARNAFRTAEASHESALRSAQIQEQQTGYGSILAPLGGTIAAVHAEVGENVQAGQPIVVVNAGTDLEVAVGLPEAVIARAVPGMGATLTFSTVPGRTFEGRVTEVSPSVDPATATYPVRVALAGASAELRAGMAASVTLTFPAAASIEDVLVVPTTAVGEDGDGRFVFIVEPAAEGVGVVRKQLVTVGHLTRDGFEIESGLSVGQQVATAGLQTLLDGQRVRTGRTP